MNSQDLNKLAYSWVSAFNLHDLEYLLSLYNDHAEHYSPKLKIRHPETNGLIKGKEALRTWWGNAFYRLPSLKYGLIRLTPHDDRVFMEYIRHVENENDLYVGEMLVVQQGLIISSAVFHR